MKETVMYVFLIKISVRSFNKSYLDGSFRFVKIISDSNLGGFSQIVLCELVGSALLMSTGIPL